MTGVRVAALRRLRDGGAFEELLGGHGMVRGRCGVAAFRESETVGEGKRKRKRAGSAGEIRAK